VVFTFSSINGTCAVCNWKYEASKAETVAKIDEIRSCDVVLDSGDCVWVNDGVVLSGESVRSCDVVSGSVNWFGVNDGVVLGDDGVVLRGEEDGVVLGEDGVVLGEDGVVLSGEEDGVVLGGSGLMMMTFWSVMISSVESRREKPSDSSRLFSSSLKNSKVLVLKAKANF